MKVAISATGNDLNSTVDPRLGRARYFIIADSESGQLVSVIDNQKSLDLAHGAGINAATKIAEAGAEVLLTGRVGPKAEAVLKSAGIRIVADASGLVKEVLATLAGKGDRSPAPMPGIDKNTNYQASENCRGQGLGMGAGRRGSGGGRCRGSILAASQAGRNKQ